ncbi:MAG: proline--tRNA ligase [Planctomycetaceae bacterium]
MTVTIKPRAQDFPQWYQDAVQAADLAENAPVRGCMVIKPYGYSLWENIRDPLDRMFKETGHENAYFPLFIPKSFLEKEAEHVEGFSPELAVVTIGGGKELEEPLVVRPTSETIIGHSYARWINSWRDLPVLINQWANVVRWEMRPRLFLRTTEFLWQEGHTCHATEEEAERETLLMLDVYERLSRDWLAIPVVKGIKSDSERFAGALRTYTIEGLMQDGKALQMGTSHNLGQNFAKAFEIQFQDQDGQRKHVWTTSWGASTRLVGAVVMTHGDDKGIVLPPKVAPIQVVAVPIYRTEEEKTAILEAGRKIVDALVGGGVRAKLDARDHLKPGPKFFEWEKKGVPVRLEIGPRDLAKGEVVVVRRDDGTKRPEKADALAALLPGLLTEIQAGLLARAEKLRDESTRDASSFAQFVELLDGPGGFVRAYWDGTRETEAAIKEKTKATVRCVPLGDAPAPGKCVLSGKPATRRALFARAY